MNFSKKVIFFTFFRLVRQVIKNGLSDFFIPWEALKKQ